MMGALVSLLSLGMTTRLVAAGQVALTLAITGATTTTPVQVTSANHGIPLARVAHAVVSNVGNMPETAGTWVLTPTDANTLTLTAFDPGGNVTNCVGSGTYTSGGTAQVAFPDYQILLGRQMVALNSAVASPRVVFVPTDGRAWGFSADGGVGSPAARPPVRGTSEQQAAALQPELATEYMTFEVLITCAANPPQPGFGDFDATQAVVDTFYGILFDMLSAPRALILHESWPSQAEGAASMTQRGQQWKGVLQIERGIRPLPQQFVPPGTTISFDIGTDPTRAYDTQFTTPPAPSPSPVI